MTTKTRGSVPFPLRVMIVEDEPQMGELFGEVLEGMGFIVCAIETSELDAIATASRCKPDLLLVDVQLLIGSGLSAVTTILDAGFIPHVFYGGDISSVQAALPDAVAIQKPFRVTELAHAIQRALSIAPPQPTPKTLA